METVSSKGSRVILVFSKAAEYGSVKTRLRPVLNDKECLQLHLAMLQDTLECCAGSGVPVVLYTAGSSEFPFPVPTAVQQADGDLGFRMKRAFEENFGAFQRVVIVGTDAPGLTVDILQEAFASLERRDLVLGPSEDGGYYLVGMKRMIAEIFENISWSSPEVLRQTLEKVPVGTAHLLPALYDVDLPADLERFEREMALMPQARRTRDWIASRRAR